MSHPGHSWLFAARGIRRTSGRGPSDETDQRLRNPSEAPAKSETRTLSGSVFSPCFEPSLPVCAGHVMRRWSSLQVVSTKLVLLPLLPAVIVMPEAAAGLPTRCPSVDATHPGTQVEAVVYPFKEVHASEGTDAPHQTGRKGVSTKTPPCLSSSKPSSSNPAAPLPAPLPARGASFRHLFSHARARSAELGARPISPDQIGRGEKTGLPD